MDIVKKAFSIAIVSILVTNQGVEAMSPIQTTGQISNTQANLLLGSIKLPATPVSLDFQEADIRDVLRLLSVKSGINMVYGVDVLGPVTVHLDQVPFDQAFQTILTLKGLVALNAGSNIIRIISSPALSTEQSQATTFTQVFRLNYLNASDVKGTIDAIRSTAGRKGVTNVDSKSNSIIVTDTREGLVQIENLLPAMDRKPQQVDIEAKIVEVTLDDDTKLGISWDYTGTKNQNTVSTAGDLTQAGTTMSLSFLHSEAAYLLSAQISALASKNKLKVLSTPHIVTLNNESASINVIDQIPYSVSSVNQGIVTTSFQFVTPGVKLSVKPTINADQRITLKVVPEISNAGSTSSPNAPPTVQTRNADTTVLLRDGETIAIGGLIKETTQKIVSGIPILMSIPILGYLFKNYSDRKVRTELIVFLTPRVVAE